jgi:hypothetical protein
LSQVAGEIVRREEANRALRDVSEEEGFRFYMSTDKPTNLVATSLNDFANKLENIDSTS